jgi:hypothetical protein
LVLGTIVRWLQCRVLPGKGCINYTSKKEETHHHHLL